MFREPALFLLLTHTAQDTSAKSFTCTYVSGNISDKEQLLKSCGFNCEGFYFFFFFMETTDAFVVT